MKFRQRQLKYLKPDENGMVTVKSGVNCKVKFTGLITYEKALIHIREESAVVSGRNEITKLKSNKQVKRYVRERDNYLCHYCGEYGDTVDHIIPRSKGGCTTPMNLVCCCKECNEKKRNKNYNNFLKEIKKKRRIYKEVTNAT